MEVFLQEIRKEIGLSTCKLPQNARNLLRIFYGFITTNYRKTDLLRKNMISYLLNFNIFFILLILFKNNKMLLKNFHIKEYDTKFLET